MTLSDTCVHIELEAEQYDKYQVPEYEPLGATQFLHSVPRITSTNFSKFENEFDEAHYLVGVLGVVACVFVVALLVLFRQAWAWRRCWQSTRIPTDVAELEALSNLHEGVSTCKTHGRETGSVLQTTCFPSLSADSTTAHVALVSGGYVLGLLGLLGVLTCCVSLSAINTGYNDGTAAAVELDSRFSIFVAGLHELDEILQQNLDALAAVENSCPESLLEISFLRPVSKTLLALKKAMDDCLTIADHIAHQLSKGTSAMPHTPLVVIVLGFLLVVDFAVLFVLGTRAYVLATECNSEEDVAASVPVWCRHVKVLSDSSAGCLIQSISLFLTWCLCGVFLAAAIFGSDYCIRPDINTINFAYKDAKPYGQVTAAQVKMGVEFYVTCPKEKQTYIVDVLTTALTLFQLESAKEGNGTISEQLKDHNVLCSGVPDLQPGDDLCCSFIAVPELLTNLTNSVCILMEPLQCPEVNELYVQLMDKAVCGQIVGHGFPALSLGLMLIAMSMACLASFYVQKQRATRRESQPLVLELPLDKAYGSYADEIEI